MAKKTKTITLTVELPDGEKAMTVKEYLKMLRETKKIPDDKKLKVYQNGTRLRKFESVFHGSEIEIKPKEN